MQLLEEEEEKERASEEEVDDPGMCGELSDSDDDSDYNQQLDIEKFPTENDESVLQKVIKWMQSLQ